MNMLIAKFIFVTVPVDTCFNLISDFVLLLFSIDIHKGGGGYQEDKDRKSLPTLQYLV